MAISKIVYKSSPSATPVTWMDATTATAAAADITAPKTAMLADGVVTQGAGTGGNDREDMCEPLDVDFIDYDGRLLYSYTAADFLNLSALPSNPSNSGLTAQGWNWTLADAQEFVGNYGSLVIGQNYTTSDGKTRVYIHVPETPTENRTLAIQLVSTVANSPKIYWGDGTNSIWTGSANVASWLSHTYTDSGDYTIEIEVLSGSISYLGRQGANSSLVGDNQRVATWVKKIEIGDDVTGIAKNPFGRLCNCKTISVPTTVTTIDDYDEMAFPRSLLAIVFPSGFTTNRYRYMFPNYGSYKYISVPKSMKNLHIDSYQYCIRKLTMYSMEPSNGTDMKVKLYDAWSLTHFVIMGTYTTIADDRFRGSSVKKLFIPSTVTSITGSSTFATNPYLSEIHLYPTSPPTLQNKSSFNNIASNFVMYVPYSTDHSILAAYQSATNWADWSTHMQEEPQ